MDRPQSRTGRDLQEGLTRCQGSSGGNRRIKVASERGAVAERLATGEVRVDRPELLSKVARAERRTAGVPVWSSYAILGLTSEGAIGQLEIHWPDLSQTVLSESKVLASLAKRGFRPLEGPGAEIESVEAGVIHSPAIGFFMDVVPVIRCIYRARDDRLGKKPVLYVDRHGELVSLPRDLMPAPPSRANGRISIERALPLRTAPDERTASFPMRLS